MPRRVGGGDHKNIGVLDLSELRAQIAHELPGCEPLLDALLERRLRRKYRARIRGIGARRTGETREGSGMRKAGRRKHDSLGLADDLASPGKGRARGQAEGKDQIALILLRNEPLRDGHEHIAREADQPGVDREHQRRHADHPAHQRCVIPLQHTENGIEAREEPVREKREVDARLRAPSPRAIGAQSRKVLGSASAS